MSTVAERVDVLIVGAGLSGVGAARHLQASLPRRTFTILEARDAIGGTWDLFRYPGVRSDSDMYTLGYRFRPWVASQAIAGGPDILRYIRDTAAEGGVERHVRFGTRVVSAAWSTADARWTVEAVSGGAPVSFTARFLYLCTGYYRYDAGHEPSFPGQEEFGGTIVHPQHWPGDLDYAGKRVAVIGSGATAVTLVPALARQAAHVTMIQRSPSYIAALPARDRVAERLRGWLGPRRAAAVTRWKNIAYTTAFYKLSQARPGLVRALLKKGATRALPPGFQSGYIQRSLHEFPKAGSRGPWRVVMSYPRDLRALRYGRISDKALRFSRRPAAGGRSHSGQPGA